MVAQFKTLVFVSLLTIPTICVHAQNKVVVVPMGGDISAAEFNALVDRVTILENAALNNLFGKLSTHSNLTCSSQESNTIDSTVISQIGGACGDGNCYTCGTPNSNLEQTENEHIFSFHCQNDGAVTVLLDNVSCDLDLYVLEDNEGFFSGSGGISCVSGSTDVANAPVANQFHCLAGNEYAIVIENVTGAASCSYDVSFETGAGLGCSEHCANGIDDDTDGAVDCDDPDCSSEPLCESP